MKGKESVVVVVLCVFVMHVHSAIRVSYDNTRVMMTIEEPGAVHMKLGSTKDGSNNNHTNSAPHERRRRQANTNVAGYDAEQRKIIVDKHNTLRATRGSSDMMYMVWDTDLEDLAQNWAEGCDFNHRPSAQRQNVGPFTYVGENLYASTGSYDPDGVIQAWYDEVSFYNYNTLGCTDVCGHYTQVVWATSSAVGCGVKYCTSLTGTGFQSGYLVACNYGPGGNFAGEHPYKLGTACSECTADAPYCVQSLCSKNAVIENGGIGVSHDNTGQFVIGCALLSTILTLNMVSWFSLPSFLN